MWKCQDSKIDRFSDSMLQKMSFANQDCQLTKIRPPHVWFSDCILEVEYWRKSLGMLYSFQKRPSSTLRIKIWCWFLGGPTRGRKNAKWKKSVKIFGIHVQTHNFFGFIRFQTELWSQSNHLIESNLPTPVLSAWCYDRSRALSQGRRGTGSDQCQKRPKFTINMLTTWILSNYCGW